MQTEIAKVTHESPKRLQKLWPLRCPTVNTILKQKKLKTFNISGMDAATLIQFGKRIDCGKPHTRGKNISPERGVVLVT